MNAGVDILGPALLFCPGNRADRFDKALQAADQAVIDLEDSVGPNEKDTALANAITLVRRPDARAIVRANRPITERGRQEIAALAAAGARRILLPKTESGAEVDAALEQGRSAPAMEFLLTVETAKGVIALPEMLSRPRIAGISWGPYDLAADMGLRSVRDEDGNFLSPIAHARDQLLLQAAAARLPAFDTVTTELGDPEQIARDVTAAVTLGFLGKFAIHPSQVPIIRAAFIPAARDVERARRMLAAAAGNAVFVCEGEMVDEPILRRARHIVALADRIGARGSSEPSARRAKG